MNSIICIVLAAIISVAAANSYAAPAHKYAAPAPVHAGPAHTYTYHSPAPTVPCAKNLLFSCAPSVAPVPCHAPHYAAPAPAYKAPAYVAPAVHKAQAASYQAPAGAYSQYVPRYALPAFRPYY